MLLDAACNAVFVIGRKRYENNRLTAPPCTCIRKFSLCTYAKTYADSKAAAHVKFHRLIKLKEFIGGGLQILVPPESMQVILVREQVR